jgi:hypothetical protein
LPFIQARRTLFDLNEAATKAASKKNDTSALTVVPDETIDIVAVFNLLLVVFVRDCFALQWGDCLKLCAFRDGEF